MVEGSVDGSVDQSNTDGEEEFAVPDSITVIYDGQIHEVPYFPTETVLECALREGLRLPFSCQIGSCATCLAKVVEGEVLMKANNVLSADEVEDGLVLVCQGIPVSKKVVIEYQ